ncbi:MAG: DUF91 domain-containing protein [Lysobacteraceae bacterium]|nr:MAG: DUF91 domain-containing protein [Xanthomonadaceae bacterium]
MAGTDPGLWKVFCEERSYPGQWLLWYQHQCAAFGWPPGAGYQFQGGGNTGLGWSRVRNALSEMKRDDWVLIALPGNRVGRLGRIVEKKVMDNQWEPLVLPGRDYPHGENGRRILLRWDMTVGPIDREWVIDLPGRCRLSAGELRPTISRVSSLTIERLREVMCDSANWVRLSGTFRHESALSDYIAAYPHRLEEGMVPHPNKRVRENTFPDRTRADVILLDRMDRTVVVECKQGAARPEHVAQLRKYLDWMKTGFPELGALRGVLVYGGSRRIADDTLREASKPPGIELAHHELSVDFMHGN